MLPGENYQFSPDATFESNWNHELTLFFVMQIQHIMIIEL